MHLQLDGWAYDIEQQLLHGDFTDRGKLQRKLMVLERLRDKYYNIAMRNPYTRALGVPRYCKRRVFHET